VVGRGRGPSLDVVLNLRRLADLVFSMARGPAPLGEQVGSASAWLPKGGAMIEGS
jgi:hypothetical protein